MQEYKIEHPYNLKEIKLIKDHSIQLYNGLSYYKGDELIVEKYPLPTDDSCDYKIIINVRGKHSVDKLNDMIKALNNALDELNNII